MFIGRGARRGMSVRLRSRKCRVHAKLHTVSVYRGEINPQYESRPNSRPRSSLPFVPPLWSIRQPYTVVFPHFFLGHFFSSFSFFFFTVTEIFVSTTCKKIWDRSLNWTVAELDLRLCISRNIGMIVIVKVLER